VADFAPQRPEHLIKIDRGSRAADSAPGTFSSLLVTYLEGIDGERDDHLW